jgi:transcriptional regulator with XRE-family HTH domain
MHASIPTASGKETAIGARIRELRTRLGLTQKQVADRTNGAYKQSSLSDLENGRIENPSLESLIGLAAGFAMDADRFLEILGVTASVAAPVPARVEIEREIVIAKIAELLEKHPDLVRGLSQLSGLNDADIYAILRTTLLIEKVRREETNP